MYSYHFSEWMLFFYIYCFLGWCFESTYVSFKEKHWVNRGFMWGPFLPIYGSGAICVLFTTLPFKSSPITVYFVGALAATLLELITGSTMEAIFKVRYWDYSKNRFNFRGHICLSSSITWGFFSLGMIYGFHRPIAYFVFLFPQDLISGLSAILTIYMSIDLAHSFKTAFDLRNFLIRSEQIKEELRLMQKRLEVMETFARDDFSKKAILAIQNKFPIFTSIEDIQNRLEDLFKGLSNEHIEQFRNELLEIRDKAVIAKEKFSQHLSIDKFRLLMRNPSAKSDKYQQALEEFKNLQNSLRKKQK